MVGESLFWYCMEMKHYDIRIYQGDSWFILGQGVQTRDLLYGGDAVNNYWPHPYRNLHHIILLLLQPRPIVNILKKTSDRVTLTLQAKPR